MLYSSKTLICVCTWNEASLWVHTEFVYLKHHVWLSTYKKKEMGGKGWAEDEWYAQKIYYWFFPVHAATFNLLKKRLDYLVNTADSLT